MMPGWANSSSQLGTQLFCMPREFSQPPRARGLSTSTVKLAQRTVFSPKGLGQTLIPISLVFRETLSCVFRSIFKPPQGSTNLSSVAWKGHHRTMLQTRRTECWFDQSPSPSPNSSQLARRLRRPHPVKVARVCSYRAPLPCSISCVGANVMWVLLTGREP